MGKNGSIYTGQVLNGKPHGSGVRVSQDGRFKYVGGWANGRWEGYGACYVDNVRVFQGKYKNDMRHGKGCEFYYPEGSKSFVGEFVRDKRHGQGIEYTKDGTSRFDIWENDKILKWFNDYQYLEKEEGHEEQIRY